MVTRRCDNQTFYLRPDPVVNQIILYEVAKAAEAKGTSIHALIAMSNHLHIGLTDPKGSLSDFMCEAIGGISKAMNRYLGRKGLFWEPEKFGETKLLDEEAIERFVNYIWLNPVKANLVEKAEEWPGLRIGPEMWGRTLEVKKPEKVYGRKSKDVAKIKFTPPPCYEDMNLEEAIQEMKDLIALEEKRYAMQRQQEGKKVVGAAAVKKINPFYTPEKTNANDKPCSMFAGDDELVEAAKKDYKDFVDRYRAKRERWVKGILRTDERFPCGTVWLRRYAGVKCEPPPDEKQNLAPPETG